MFQCIGQQRVQKHEADRGQLVRCTNESSTPTNTNKPEWGWLCPACSGAPAVKNSPKEVFNANAAQDDVTEFRDQIDAGVMIGIRGSFRDGEGEENE